MSAPSIGSTPWHRLTSEQALAAVGTPEGGLGAADARARLALVVVAICAIALQGAVVDLPWCNRIFETEPLQLPDLALAVGASLIVLVAVEIEKLVRRRRGWA